MKRNIYLDSNQFVPNPKRNAYDMSKLVNGTYRSGYIYPIDVEEVTFGDSLKLNFSAGIRTMPMVWPIQTPIIAKFYSFYVRYRTIMDDFEDFRFNNKSVVHPYIALDAGADFWKTGELGDHLGIPTTYASPNAFLRLNLFNPDIPGDSTPKKFFPFVQNSSQTLGLDFSTSCSYTPTGEEYGICRMFSPVISKTMIDSDTIFFDKNLFADGVSTSSFTSTGYAKLFLRVNGVYLVAAYIAFSADNFQVLDDGNVKFSPSYGTVTVASFFPNSAIKSAGLFGFLKSLSDTNFSVENSEYFLVLSEKHDTAADAHVFSTTGFEHNDPTIFGKVVSGSGLFELNEVSNPFAGVSPVIPLSALYPRAYEAIYRSYFQDLINEPFIVNGEAQYNRYVTTYGSGADTTDYKLFRRNWEADFLTSAKPSPQQGMAPIVGITSSGNITLIKGDGSEYSVHVNVDDDDRPASIDWATENQPSDSSVRRTLLDLATSGITINALRNTNAFQKWVEANYRRGLKFKDQVLSNFGVRLEYKELDMPEFLGGFSIPLNVNTINQTSSSVEGSPLGEIAGNGGFYGRANHSISHYFDEEGCVISLMCITPIPVYSQLLNRRWIKQTPVDYYNPQFGKIGNQPITYEEVCPIQAYNEGRDVHDVFGYQRPWYHMISSVDEVHGLMRNEMSGFVMQRIFGSTPELGANFLHIDEDQMNEVFVVRDDKQDTFYGQIGVKKYKKTCIPRYALPSLG